jgi:two-component system, chemotaxis family, sensor kinase CheA
MALESAPDDQATIDGILREAHTMKGAAGMVGMMRVSRLAHRLEDLLVELRSGARRSTPELTDSMLLVVDGLARLIASPSSGDQDMSDEAAMERLLPTTETTPSPGTPTPSPVPAAALAPPARPTPAAASMPAAPTPAAPVAATVPVPTPVAAAAPAPPPTNGHVVAPKRVSRPRKHAPNVTPAPAAALEATIIAVAPKPNEAAATAAASKPIAPPIAGPPVAELTLPAPLPVPIPAIPGADRKSPLRALDGKRLDTATLEVPVARIDELNRLVGEVSAAQLRVGHVFGSELRLDPDAITEYRELTKVINQLQEVTERTRMVPVGTLEPILHRTVRDIARSAGKNVRWEMLGEDIEVDRGVLEQLVSPLLHLVRNSIGHGVETPEQRVAAGKPEQAVVRLHATQVGSKVVIAISDDGAGINVPAVRAAAAKSGIDISGLTEEESMHLIFHSGLSTAKTLTETSGRGVGLDVVANAVAAVHGTVHVASQPGLGTEFRIIVPITLTVVACLIVSIGGQSFALPLHRIIRMLDAQSVQVVSGKKLAVVDGLAVPVSDLAELLGLPNAGTGPWVLVGTEANPHAFQVETVLQKRDVVVRGLTGRLRDLKAVSGASIEPNGTILLVLDVSNLIERSSAVIEPGSRVSEKLAGVAPQLRVMVVDDTLMVRELQRSILERGGYRVRTASDGAEALALLNEEPADLVVTDLEMPNLDGFQLTKGIRAHPRLANVPVLIVSSHASEEDQQRGLDAGADGYIIKTSFDEAGLLSAVSRLLGRSGPPERRAIAPTSSVKPAPAATQR